MSQITKEDKLKFKDYIKNIEYKITSMNELINKYYQNIYVDIDKDPMFGIIDIDVYAIDEDNDKELICWLNLLPSRKFIYLVMHNFDMEYVIDELLNDFGYKINKSVNAYEFMEK